MPASNRSAFTNSVPKQRATAREYGLRHGWLAAIAILPEPRTPRFSQRACYGLSTARRKFVGPRAATPSTHAARGRAPDGGKPPANYLDRGARADSGRSRSQVSARFARSTRHPWSRPAAFEGIPRCPVTSSLPLLPGPQAKASSWRSATKLATTRKPEFVEPCRYSSPMTRPSRSS
jgi:hypothetical protein